MSEITMELVYGGAGPPDGEVAVVRLLGRLPGGWHYEQQHIGPVLIQLRIMAPLAGPADIEGAVVSALGDPALLNWRVLTADG
ncbi:MULTISPECIES: hypothetical protein [unclassified Streptomyces]|uniref:hypothetical protein n=1 Tax=unclassified Streptomyces TaxID=2593676 RepID=UPI000CD5342D|nr:MULTISPECIES: hypothetical protein [unclassified Streptomyces]